MSLNLYRSVRIREISSLTLQKVRVEDIPETGLDLHVKGSQEQWNRHLQEIPACQFSINQTVEATLRLRIAGKAVQVEGSLHTGLDLQCCRCLKVFSSPLISQFDVILVPETDVADQEEVELAREDLEASFFSGEEIDVSGLVREQIVLNVPYKPLCSEQCRGLCPRCGANLNEEKCGCGGKTWNSAFEVLKNLRLGEK